LDLKVSLVMTVWMVIQGNVVNVVSQALLVRKAHQAHKAFQVNLALLVLLAVFTTQMDQEPHNNVAGFKAALQYKIANNDV
jgi:hypothetical protein